MGVKCAGAKLCMVAELLGASGSLTAVDIAQPRLAACRTMLQKYGLGSRIRLYLGDGTTFSLLPLKETTKLPDFHLGAEGMEKKTCLLCSLGMYLHISELKCGSRSLSE
jgi:hypothetical protein